MCRISKKSQPVKSDVKITLSETNREAANNLTNLVELGKYYMKLVKFANNFTKFPEFANIFTKFAEYTNNFTKFVGLFNKFWEVENVCRLIGQI